MWLFKKKLNFYLDIIMNGVKVKTIQVKFMEDLKLTLDIIWLKFKAKTETMSAVRVCFYF